MKKIKWVLFLVLLFGVYAAGVYTAPHLTQGWTEVVGKAPFLQNRDLSYLNPIPYVMALSLSTLLIIGKVILAYAGWLILTKTKKLNLVKLFGLVLFIVMVLSLVPTLIAVGIIALGLVLLTGKLRKTKHMMTN